MVAIPSSMIRMRAADGKQPVRWLRLPREARHKSLDNCGSRAVAFPHSKKLRKKLSMQHWPGSASRSSLGEIMYSRTRRCFCFALAIMCVCLLAASWTSAQQTLGGITGTVTDPSGSVLPDTQVTAAGDQTGLKRAVKTDGNGAYLLVNLPIGNYTLNFTHEGFNAEKVPAILVQADRTVTLNAQLKVGSVTESVPVEAQPLLNAVHTTH